jgi:predicted extracellular nuclease
MIRTLAGVAATAGCAAATTIAEINGRGFLSPLVNTNVTDVRGLVTAKSTSGFYLRSAETNATARQSGLYVYGSNAAKSVSVGDIITVDGAIQEYRSDTKHIPLTELSFPVNVVVESSGNEVEPFVLGTGSLLPPVKRYTKLDVGGVFGVPNGVNLISESNPDLRPSCYGLDFWEALVGQLVTIPEAYQVSRPNQYGDVWVRGDWPVTGINEHGGLTLLPGGDANPEAIIIGSPLDGSKNPDDTRMGDFIGDVTGIVTYQFGFYRLLPLTNVSPLQNATTDFPATEYVSDGTCSGLTVASYNTENLMPDSAHLPSVVSQIVEKLLLPDIVFVQEVQDNSGEANDGVVSANVTLSTLTEAIEDASGIAYGFTEVEPVDGEDGGQPGGNIRVAYLYKLDTVELYKPNPGGPLDANEVLEGPELSFNPGRIDPADEAWTNSRKPVVAQWKTTDGNSKVFFTVNVHFGSKGGSSSLHGDPRPPLNGGVEDRQAQAELTANFIAEIMAQDPEALVITAGDFNEFTQVQPLVDFAGISGMEDLDVVVGIPPEERYSYLFDMNCQTLDHTYVSPALAATAKFEHLHLNTWQNYDDQTSDHDPSIALLNVCA